MIGDELRALVIRTLPEVGDEERDMALRAVQRLFQLYVFETVGHRNEAEVAVLQATLLNLSATTRTRLNSALKTWWNDRVQSVADEFLF